MKEYLNMSELCTLYAKKKKSIWKIDILLRSAVVTRSTAGSGYIVQSESHSQEPGPAAQFVNQDPPSMLVPFGAFGTTPMHVPAQRSFICYCTCLNYFSWQLNISCHTKYVNLRTRYNFQVCWRNSML